MNSQRNKRCKILFQKHDRCAYFCIGIAVVVILNIMLFGRKKKGKDELSEDDDPELDEPENEDDEANEETETEKKPFLGKFRGFRKKEKNEDEDDYFDDEEEYIEEEHPINRAYREWNDYEDEIPSTSEKSVTEEKSEKKSSTENEKMMCRKKMKLL